MKKSKNSYRPRTYQPRGYAVSGILRESVVLARQRDKDMQYAIVARRHGFTFKSKLFNLEREG